MNYRRFLYWNLCLLVWGTVAGLVLVFPEEIGLVPGDATLPIHVQEHSSAIAQPDEPTIEPALNHIQITTDLDGLAAATPELEEVVMDEFIDIELEFSEPTITLGNHFDPDLEIR